MNIRQQSLNLVTLLCYNTVLGKIWAGAGYAARAYIYQGSSVSDMELNSPQCLLLALLHSLVTEDIMSCCLLANVCHQVQQLQSDYLKVWLTGDFEFPHQDMEKALNLLAKLLSSGVLKLPSHITRIISSLAAKYRVDGTQLIPPFKKGRDDLANSLEEAVLNNNPGDIIAIAGEGGDVNGSTQSGDSLIHLAARVGNCSSIAALGFLKVDLEVMNLTNATPLEEAVKNNQIYSAKALLSAGAKVDKCLLRGDTYLHIAAEGGHSGVLEVLLENETDVNKKNYLGETPLFRAIKAGNVCGVEILLKKGANAGIFPEGSKSLLEMIVELKNVGVLKALMKGGMHGMGIDVNDRTEKGETLLHLSSAKGSLELVRTLCQEGADVEMQDNRGISALMIALQNSKEDIAEFLLHNGANPNIKDNEGRTALHYATERGCIQSVATLLDAGARVNNQDNKGDSPVLVAAVNNKPLVLQLLVQNGADLALKDQNGYGILHLVAQSGYVEIMTALLDAGAEVDMKNQYQWTALHYATHGEHIEVVTALLNHGADPAAKRFDGSTPLIVASCCGHLDMVQLLIGQGAPVNDKNDYGQTALFWANVKNHRAVADYLRSKGGVE